MQSISSRGPIVFTYPPKGAAIAEPKVVQLFLLMFYFGLGNVYRIFNFAMVIHFFESHENLYPMKGAAIAEPVWGPIDFFLCFIILSCVLETYLGVSKCALLSAF